MQFSVKEWRRMYDLVQELGATLRDSRPTYDENDNYVSPKIELSKDAQILLESRIRSLTLRSSRYLDQCGVRPNRPLWHYDRKNPETHISAPEFKYGHLVGDAA